MEMQSGYAPDQVAYAARVYERLQQSQHPPRAHVVTYGCQQNVSDSERIKGMLALCGYTMTDTPENADFILFNTCAVRAHAEDRVLGNVGAMKHYKRRNPHLILAVCGCMAQQDRVIEHFRKSFPYVNLVFGTQVQHRLPEFIYRCLSGERVFENALPNDAIPEQIPILRDGTVKGFLPVMYGCNNFCTYCIVPYVRGRERSRESAQILAEARQMVAAGFKEIMLLGQNVNSYGKDRPGEISFAELLRKINAIEGDFRIRFMTSHPKDCTAELLDALRDCTKVARHLHLPFQSGSDGILKRMNRHYDRATYLNLIDEARKRVPDIALTTDIIVGFPGETAEDFEQTLSLVQQVRFTSLFTFIFSPRAGTPAAQMADPIDRAEKGRWFNRLLRLQEEIGACNLQAAVGKTARVLIEEPAAEDGCFIGHTDGNLSVKVRTVPEKLNQLISVRITAYDGTLYAEEIEGEF